MIRVFKIIAFFALGLVLAMAIASQFKQAKLRTINHFMPGAYAPLLQAQQVPAYIRYYRLVFYFTPAKADALYMLGFCYTKNQQWPQAIAAYERALRLNPSLFWARYNLAMLHFYHGQKNNVQEHLNAALRINPTDAVQVLLTSKIFMDVAGDLNMVPSDMAARLMTAYQKSALSLSQGKVPPEEWHVF